MARVLTLSTDARLVVWAADVRPAALKAPVVLTDLSDATVSIDHTFHLGAFHLGVASVARATGAVRTVVHWLALSVGSTSCGARTWVQALTIDAGFCGWTIGIRPAPGKAQSSFANVVPRAQCIGCANQAAPLLNATFVVEALIVTAACNSTNSGFTVTSETTLIICVAFLRFSDAFEMCVSNEAGWAAADLLVASNCTQGIRSACCGCLTGIDAMVLDARLVGRAIGIGTATNFAEVVLADFPVKALTVAMALNVAPVFHAPFVQGAVLVAAARHSTVSQVADVSWGALLIVRATNWLPHTSYVGMRTADELSRAAAHDTVVDHFALRIGATGGTAFTRISALVTDAGKMVQALLIRATSNLTSVGDAHFSLLALIVRSAEGITVLVEAAFSICTVAIRRAFHSAPCLHAGVVVSATVARSSTRG